MRSFDLQETKEQLNHWNKYGESIPLLPLIPMILLILALAKEHGLPKVVRR